MTPVAARRTPRAVIAVLLALVASAALAPAASAKLPVIYSVLTGAPGFLQRDASPPGANDFSCKPSAARPRPVVLVHGTFANRAANFGTLSPLLKNAGYCVFAPNYGFTGASGGFVGGLAPARESAAELHRYVDRVRSATGASKVDLVGHSQGGMLPNYYVKFLGGASEVRRIVGLAPSNRGTTLLGLSTLGDALQAAFPAGGAAIERAVGSQAQGPLDQRAGSPFMRELNSRPDTVPGIDYTTISTRFDQVVTPYRSQFLNGGGGTTTNITIQSKCALDASDHVSIAFDHVAAREVLNALDPSSARRTVCTPVLPGIGG